MPLDWAWFDRNAGAIEALAALGMLVFTAVLVFVARRQAAISAKQVQLQADIHRKEGPILLLHFSGFQSQPHDPKNEMLWLMVGVGNEGRRDVRVTHLEIEVLDPKEEGYHSYALYPRADITHGQDDRGLYTPHFPAWFGEAIQKGEDRQAGGIIKSHDAESFYVALPAGQGYEAWRKVRLRVSGIGVEPATKELDWDPWWLRRGGT